MILELLANVRARCCKLFHPMIFHSRQRKMDILCLQTMEDSKVAVRRTSVHGGASLEEDCSGY